MSDQERPARRTRRGSRPDASSNLIEYPMKRDLDPKRSAGSILAHGQRTSR